MLGLPKMPDPVFIKSFAGAWLNKSVLQVRTMVISSAIEPMCGKHSLAHIPLWPCCLNFLMVPCSFWGFLNELFMKANRFPLMNDSGIFWPSLFTSSGFQSKRSKCEGPPAIKRNMTFFAFGGKWNCFMDPWLGNALLFMSEPSAIDPSPIPHWPKKWRRVVS